MTLITEDLHAGGDSKLNKTVEISFLTEVGNDYIQVRRELCLL